MRALAALYDGAVDRLLAGDERVTSARQGKAIIAGDDGAEELADRIQRVAVLAVPLVRTLARGARFTRVPWVLVASTVASTTLTIRAGVREVQTIASFLAYRIEQQTQAPADPALVKKLTFELYLAPRSTPDLSRHAPVAVAAPAALALARRARPRHRQAGGEGPRRSRTARRRGRCGALARPRRGPARAGPLKAGAGFPSVVGEQAVELFARVAEDRLRGLELILRSGGGNLPRRVEYLEDEVA